MTMTTTTHDRACALSGDKRDIGGSRHLNRAKSVLRIRRATPHAYAPSSPPPSEAPLRPS
jgi:hypothetical protein